MSRFLTHVLAAAGVAVGGSTLLAQQPPTIDVMPVTFVEGDLIVPDVVAAPAAVAPCESCVNWKAIPRTRPFPRPGNFPIPPAGPGYYSARDALMGDCLEAPPKYPYPRFGLIQPSFFDTDNFSYLDDPKNTECDLFDPLKRIRFGDCWMLTTGGDARVRYEANQNARLGQSDNNFLLTRVRAYADVWYGDRFRVFGEFIGAWTDWQNLAPLPIDRTHADILNLFVDLKLAEWDGSPAYVRAGRQELLFGSQRLISPLEWANTRRTFQGIRTFRQTEQWDVDLFWVQPVVPNAPELDSVDNNQNFAGAWVTHRPDKTSALDVYYLMLDNTNSVRQLGLQRGQFTRHTFGGRYSGTKDQVLFDFEGAMQLGSQEKRNVVAGMATAGAGYHFKDSPLTPILWAYYDYASGGGADAGTAHTFHQLFPFGHYYQGWIDQVGRQNIHDLNAHLYLYPSKWVTTWIQFHNFWLADSRDALYNAAGNAIRRDPTGASGKFVGHEIDLVLNFHLSKHADLLTGYSHLWGGGFLRNTAGPANASSANFFFAQAGYRW